MSTRTFIGALSFLAVFVSACGSSSSGDAAAPGGPTASGGSSGATGATGWTATACGTCIQSTCATSWAACEGDPSCAAYLSCLSACAPDAAGNADPTCASACPAPNGSESQMLQASLQHCRDTSSCACGASGAGGAGGGGGGAGGGAGGSMAGSGGAGGVAINPILTQMCPSTSSDPTACGSCIDTKCCDTYMACHNDATCKAFQACVKGCSAFDYACLTMCDAMNPGGITNFAPYWACTETLCLAPCGGTTNACASCVASKCPNSWVNCEGDPQCLLADHCLGACATSDTACQNACIDKYPTAKNAILASGECVDMSCSVECK